MFSLSIIFIASSSGVSGSTVLRGEDITSPTLISLGTLSSATTLKTRSLSVTIPTGCPSASFTMTDPILCSLITFAASTTLRSSLIATTGLDMASRTTIFALKSRSNWAPFPWETASPYIK